MNKFRAQKGFTIIETLVAITILMIAITGPLVVASRGLFGANLAKNQMIASYLAQESMEVVKNIRDNNIIAGTVSWLYGFSSCTRSSLCDASAIDAGNSILNCGSSPCVIYVETHGYGHTNNSGAVISPFTRSFYIHEPGATSDCALGATECAVTVEVQWTDGGVPYSILLTSEIGDALR